MVDREQFLLLMKFFCLKSLIRGEQKESNLLLQLQLFLYFDIFNCKKMKGIVINTTDVSENVVKNTSPLDKKISFILESKFKIRIILSSIKQK